MAVLACQLCRVALRQAPSDNNFLIAALSLVLCCLKDGLQGTQRLLGGGQAAGSAHSS